MILVTGGTGFLGSALLRTLDAQQSAVRCVGFQSRRHAGRGTQEYVATDLRQVDPDSAIFDSVDTIVHLASTTIPETSMADMPFDARSNLDMALRLLEAARVRGIKHFLFASSAGTVYGDPVRLPTRETDPTDPWSSYGVVKLMIEKYIGLYARLHGIRGISLRISNPYGSGQFLGAPIGVLARLLQHAHDGTDFRVWGDGSIVRDYFHVDDLMRAMLLALAEPAIPSGVYNVAAGRGTSINELIALVREVTGRALTVHYEPARRIDVPKIWLDATKFRAATGWRPTIELEDGVRDLWRNLLATRGGR